MISEALRQVLTDGELKKKMVRKGLVQASKFSWRKAADETRKVYQELGAIC